MKMFLIKRTAISLPVLLRSSGEEVIGLVGFAFYFVRDKTSFHCRTLML